MKHLCNSFRAYQTFLLLQTCQKLNKKPFFLILLFYFFTVLNVFNEAVCDCTKCLLHFSICTSLYLSSALSPAGAQKHFYNFGSFNIYSSSSACCTFRTSFIVHAVITSKPLNESFDKFSIVVKHIPLHRVPLYRLFSVCGCCVEMVFFS